MASLTALSATPTDLSSSGRSGMPRQAVRQKGSMNSETAAMTGRVAGRTDLPIGSFPPCVERHPGTLISRQSVAYPTVRQPNGTRAHGTGVANQERSHEHNGSVLKEARTCAG